MVAAGVSLRVGQLLKGRQASYKITQQLFPTIWLATSTSSSKPMIVKSVDNWLINNERHILKRFQRQAPSLRQLVDEIDDPSSAPAIVLQHLDEDLLKVGITRRISKPQVKKIAREILSALDVLHDNNFVHTDVKPDNILVNWAGDTTTVEEARLSDCGTTVIKTSRFARAGHAIGAPLWRSPEATLGMRWGTPTDIWSFGSTLVTLLVGNNFFLFRPDVPLGHADYTAKILESHCRYFAPSPLPGFNIAVTNEVVAALESTIHKVQRLDIQDTSFESMPHAEKLSTADKVFIKKIMQLNPTDRPTAKQLLHDEWFNSVD